MTPLKVRKLMIKIIPFLFLVLLFLGCPKPELPYYGFPDATSLQKADNYVMAESSGGKLDPKTFAKPDQRYAHDGIAYNEQEEGYYQWGYALYKLGYRDADYIRELAPKAF